MNEERLFRKYNVEPQCKYCVHSSLVSGLEYICPKAGVVRAGNYCRRFEYDVYKREPETLAPRVSVQEFDPEVFRL
ncbi:MAG: hypothetical protein LBQ91_00030 [Oscillospiraceae bacterium]|jgi:hypothetical protein|nr:hypothetical protein [Oscillospiraceae bacterium]